MKSLHVSILLIVFVGSISFAQNNSWTKKHYNVTGNVTVETNNGKTILVIHENFKTSKGPDLKLFLTKKTAASVNKNDAVEKYGVLIGELKSNKGAQRYVLPASIDVNEFSSLVIHCEKYTKVWGAKPI